MITNYIRIAWRSVVKNKLFSIVNIFGLACAIAAFLFINTYVNFERSYEDFNPNGDNVVRITLDLYNGAEYVATDCETHPLMGPMMKERVAAVKDYLRMFDSDGLRDVQVGDQKFLEGRIFFSDPSIFNMLGVQMIDGDPSKALNDPYQLVITESKAKTFFGRTNVKGETLLIDNSLYNITGVIADPQPNTHIKYDLLLSHSTLPKEKNWYKEDSWNGNNEYTYFLMEPGADLAAFNQELLKVSDEIKDKINNGKYVAEPIKSIHLYSHKTFEPEVNGNAKVVYFLGLIAIFIIVIAWVNYMNLGTARAVERAREVGVRKVMGSMRRQLIIQFLMESFIVNLAAASIGLLLFVVATPLFRNLAGLPAELNFINNTSFWVMLAGLATIGAVLSGIYPAFVLSSFRPVTVLKGKLQSSAHGQFLRKALVVFQFGATVVLIIAVSTVYMQVKHLRSVDLGMDLEQTMAIRLPREKQDSIFTSTYSSFKNDMMRESFVQSVGRADALPGLSISELSSTQFSRIGHESETGQYEYYFHAIDEDFIPTMGIQLVAGKNFSSSVNTGNVLINEEAVKRLGFKDAQEAIGSQIGFRDWRNGKPTTVIGVVKNYYQRSPKEAHIPMLYPYYSGGAYLTLRLKTEDMKTAIAYTKDVWAKNYPGAIFHYFFLDETYDQQYHADVQFGEVMGTFSALAVIIACLGLFGLSSYTIVQRTKEIGIRKVLGASVGQVVTLLSGGYLRIILLAAVLALPVAWFAVDNWLSGYTVRIDLSVWLFIAPVALILAVALITVSFQTLRSAVANPAESLKHE